METPRQLPELVASTGSVYCCSTTESHTRENALRGTNDYEGWSYVEGIHPADAESNYFKSAQWTPDGTTLLTSSADNTIRTFILPPTLLDPRPSPPSLAPCTDHSNPTSLNCLSPYPFFDLSTPSTTLYLTTPTDLPIRLTNALSPSPTPTATYSLVSPTTEAYLTPSSLCWSSPGTHFVTGTDCLISLFDVSRNGSEPVTRMPTIPSKRHRMKDGGVGMRGIVSALAVQSSSEGTGEGMLAAGTWTRWVGLYDAEGMGGTVANWEVKEAADEVAGIEGAGVSQAGWSACGTYLYVVERKSRGVLVYDVRFTRKLVCWLVGREAVTNQRLGVDFFQGENGAEVWAGGTDGVVRVWEGVGQTEGKVDCSWEWWAHDDPVTSTTLHSTGMVAVTCSGQRSVDCGWSNSSNDDDSDENDDNESSASGDTPDHSANKSPDNSIKVWKL